MILTACKYSYIYMYMHIYTYTYIYIYRWAKDVHHGRLRLPPGGHACTADPERSLPAAEVLSEEWLSRPPLWM